MPDLHTHSTASDGTLTPTQLVRRAAAAGVRVLALTDHDTTAGLAEAAAAAGTVGIRLIPGVELSVTWGERTIHLLGLSIDPGADSLRLGLAQLAAYRDARADEIARCLAAVGIDGAYAGAAALATGAQIGRAHFARFLVSRGYAHDVRGVFKHYLVKGKPGHVAGSWPSLEQAAGWIHAAGGRAVIAHPARYRFSNPKMKRLIGELKENGGVGIEVVSGSHGKDDVHVFGRLSREHRLLASAGSDYHGPETPWLDLGRLPPLPTGCTPLWHDWLDDAVPLPRVAQG